MPQLIPVASAHRSARSPEQRLAPDYCRLKLRIDAQDGAVIRHGMLAAVFEVERRAAIEGRMRPIEPDQLLVIRDRAVKVRMGVERVSWIGRTFRTVLVKPDGLVQIKKSAVDLPFSSWPMAYANSAEMQ